MSAVMVRMDVIGEGAADGDGAVGFFLRLGLAIVVLYVSLKYLDGRFTHLRPARSRGVLLLIESLRLIKAWTI